LTSSIISTGSFNSENTRILLSPSWAQAVTESFLARTRETADRLGKVPIHMHCLQTPIHKAFSLRRYGQTAVAWLDERGLIDERVSLGHAIWVTDRDIDILAARRASITTHPSCNLGMRNGLAPVYEMARRGVNVAMGLDDKTIDDDEDAVMELRMLHKLHRVPSYDLATPALTAREVLAMGMLNGARALGFGGRLGALTPDLKADAILVDLDRAGRSVAHRRARYRGGVHASRHGRRRGQRGHRRPGGHGGPQVHDDGRPCPVQGDSRRHQEHRRRAAPAGPDAAAPPALQSALVSRVAGRPTQPFYVLNSRI
jgi:cytosine/adenosine deaminase-related metal-dependent hydrolase